MRHLVEFLIIHLVNHPDAVGVAQQQKAGTVILEITAHPDDIGRIIGHKGKRIKAIRKICSIWGIKNNNRVRINVIG